MVVAVETEDYPDIERVLITHLRGLLGDTAAVDTVSHEPLSVRVRRVGGIEDGITDSARVRIDVTADTRAEAHQLSEALRTALVGSAGVGGLNGAAVTVDDRVQLVDTARTDVPPEGAPEADPELDTVISYYRFACRRPRRRSS